MRFNALLSPDATLRRSSSGKENPAAEAAGRLCCLLPHSRQRQEQDEHGAANVQRRVFVYSSDGGGEENRTPVRKLIDTAFYERRLSIRFPERTAGSQAVRSGSFIVS